MSLALLAIVHAARGPSSLAAMLVADYGAGVSGGLLVNGRERESGQRLGNRLGEFRQRSSINATRLNRIARMLGNAV